MCIRGNFGLFLMMTWLATPLHAEVQVVMEHLRDGKPFAFSSVPAPAVNDAATEARLVVLSGDRDRNGGPLSALQDGRLPQEDDQPRENFFFRSGSQGGRLLIDLQRIIAIKRLGTYSWHSGARAPQVYTLYVPVGQTAEFNPEPAPGTDPTSCGWKIIGDVDSRNQEDSIGGQHGVAVIDSEGGILGRYRYLLLDVYPTEADNPFGHTFYSEIDVEDAAGPQLKPIENQIVEPILLSFQAEPGPYHFIIDATAAPDLRDWAEAELVPVVQEWYPKLVALLPGDGFNPSTNLTLRFRSDMGGTPASAGRGRINMNAVWFRRELNREARGSVVHEMVHIIQDYGRARRLHPDAAPTPGWLVEGIADYIRWFLYEPETRGAEITARNFSRAHYDASYRITGNFLDWVTREHDADIVMKLNAAAREGRYREELWEQWTGRTLENLGQVWRNSHAQRLDLTDP